MNDNRKNKAQLVKELKILREHVEGLERGKQPKIDIKPGKGRVEHALRERIKELACLYGVAEVIERCGDSLDKILQGIAELLPDSWQYPEITSARIFFKGKQYMSLDFAASHWKQAAEIVVSSKKAGTVEVYYLEEKPVLDEGPFLKEERLLIDAVAERISRVAERIQAEQLLETKRASIQNMNIALREVLGRVQDEKQEIAMSIQANVDKIIVPILITLEEKLPSEHQEYISLLKRNLEEIAAPFTGKLSKVFSSLTPAEIQICNMIKNGLSAKEVSVLRHISVPTVNRHREHIRRKLGLTNKNINLTTYLQNFMTE